MTRIKSASWLGEAHEFGTSVSAVMALRGTLTHGLAKIPKVKDMFRVFKVWMLLCHQHKLVCKVVYTL